MVEAQGNAGDHRGWRATNRSVAWTRMLITCAHNVYGSCQGLVLNRLFVKADKCSLVTPICHTEKLSGENVMPLSWQYGLFNFLRQKKIQKSFHFGFSETLPRLGNIRRPSKHKQPDDWERGTEDPGTIRFYLEIGIMWLGQYGRKLVLEHFQMLKAHINYAIRVTVVREAYKKNYMPLLMMHRRRACSQRVSLYLMLDRQTFLRVFTMHAHQSKA